MKRFLKRAAVTAIVLIVFVAISVICNMNGIDLDAASNGSVIAVCVMLIYQGLTSNEK